MKKTTLRNYARLIARKGVNIKRGQQVEIRAELDQPEFITILVQECYRAGAGYVHVEFNHQPIEKHDYKYCSLKTLSTIEDWQLERLKFFAKKLPARIYIISEDPDGMKGINQEKAAKAQQAIYPKVKPIIDQMEGKYQWCIAAVPGEKWAKKVFPGLKKNEAMKKLWDAILYTSRADGDDPIAAWDAHNADIHARCDYLNSLGIDYLHYTSKNGTDFRVWLMKESRFAGGSEKTLSGRDYNPNIPSEECFTSPMKGKAEGTVIATKPLSYRGELIENFSITFKDGKAVEVHAEKNEELLKQMISMDEGAAMLGECALVPYDSPIRNSGILFYNTLFDENACCHLALGMGFMECVDGHENMTIEQCRELGLNDSMNHEDFMIGSEDLSIDAVTRDGKTVPIFRNGNWAF